MDRNLPLKKKIAKNLELLLNERRWTQLKLSQVSGVSKSTISDYINCKTLINPMNVGKISDAFEVPKWKIDPSYSLVDTSNDNNIIGILADLLFAYINKDEDFPHDFEIKAVENAVKVLEENYSGDSYSLDFFEKALKIVKSKV